MDSRAPESATRSVVLSALWRGKVAIAATAVVLGVVAYEASMLQDEQYESTATVVLSASQSFDPLGQYQNPDPAGFVADQMALMRSRVVLEAAQADAGVTSTELGKDLELRAGSAGSVISVTATGDTARGAAAEANAVVAAYRAYVLSRVTAVSDAATAANTPAAPVNDDQRVAAAQTLADIETRQSQYGDGVETVDAAVAPTEPSSPVPLRDGVIAAVVGALLAAGVVLWRRGSRPQDTRVLLREAGIPVLGSLQVGGTRGPAPAVDVEAATAPLLSLQFLTSERVPGPVLVSDLRPGSGSVDTVVALATAAARQGSTVAVLSVDEDASGLLTRLGVAGAPVPLTSAADVEPGHLAPVQRLVDTDRRVVGHVARLSGRLTRSGDRAAVLSALVAAHDVVLVHGRPLAQSAGAFAVVRDCAAVVAVVAAEDTQNEVAEAWTALADRLGVAGRGVDGVVVTHRRRGMLRAGSGAGSAASSDPAPAALSPAPAPIGAQPARPVASSPSDR